MPVPASTPPSPAGAPQYSWYPENWPAADRAADRQPHTQPAAGGTLPTTVLSTPAKRENFHLGN
ncbi:hypothetical protein DSO57_1001768 [Entomophthora muscae]|uniref:Uncharacterized protein n=1 Tax=Entomophthora muscae TaxID=34485 RepID=A0ACC2T8W9_9FUNG|nr:hypothetical protein DSO57_1001768 [Entomophthora muscae]